MKKNTLNIEHIIIFTIALAAALIRLFQLGVNPLTDSEARLALEAINLSKGVIQISPAGPLYSIITGLLFFVFGSSNYLARVVPALFGILLVFSPILVREKIGRGLAILLSLVFTLDPALVALSRQAGSEIISVAGLIFILVFIFRKNAVWLGVTIALAMMSGEKIWVGLIPLAISVVTFVSITHRYPTVFITEIQISVSKIREQYFYSRSIFWFALVILLGGSMFFIAPGILGAIAGSFPNYLSQFSSNSVGSISTLLITYIVYEPIPLILGLIGIIRSIVRKDVKGVFLGSSWFLSILFILFMPGRENGDICWSVIPLWILALREGMGLFGIEPQTDKGLLIGITFLAAVLIAFIALNLLGFLNPMPGNVEDQLRLAGIGSGIILFLLLGFLFGWAWSKELVFKGLGSGILLFLVIYSISCSVRAGGHGQHPEAEPWNTSPYFQEADLLKKTIGDVSEWNKGDKRLIDVAVLGINSPSLEWVLRDARDVMDLDSLPVDAKPSIVITDQNTNLSLIDPYRGQDFIIKQKPNWSLLLMPEWASWVVYRKAPLENENIILWVRSDLFPGNTSTQKP